MYKKNLPQLLLNSCQNLGGTCVQIIQAFVGSNLLRAAEAAEAVKLNRFDSILCSNPDACACFDRFVRVQQRKHL